MLDNALEDVVPLFEGFLKHVYSLSLQAESRINSIKVNFQRLEGAEKLFTDDLKYDLFVKCTASEREFLQDQFLKRHVLTHNLGLVDAKSLDKAKSYQKQGSEIDISPLEITRALDIVENIVQEAIRHMEETKTPP